jgi:hypothetical protein
MARGLLFMEIKANPEEGIFLKLRLWLWLVKFLWFGFMVSILILFFE